MIQTTCYPKISNCDIICPNDYLYDKIPLCATNSTNIIDCYPAYLKCTDAGRSQTSLERNNDPQNILLKMKMWGKQASAQASVFPRVPIQKIKTTQATIQKAASVEPKYYIIIIIIIVIIFIKIKL